MGVLYISYSVVDDQRHKQPPCLALLFVHNWPLKGWSQLLTRNNGEGAKNSKGAHLSLLHQRQNMKGHDSTVQGKKHTDKSFNLEKIKQDKLKAQPGCMNCFR